MEVPMPAVLHVVLLRWRADADSGARGVVGGRGVDLVEAGREGAEGGHEIGLNAHGPHARGSPDPAPQGTPTGQRSESNRFTQSATAPSSESRSSHGSGLTRTTGSAGG